MTESPPPSIERAFTLIELLVVIATITILVAIALPAFSGVLERAKATKDLSNLRQIGSATQMYMNDNNNVFPGSATQTWTFQLEQNQKYLSSWRVLESPFDKRSTSELGNAATAISYGINHNMYAVAAVSGNMLKVASPASTFFMAPNYPSATGDPTKIASWPGNATNAPDLPVGGAGETKGTHSNGQKINVLFCDWHTETLTFGPASADGTFQDTTHPLGLKHWDPTQ